MNDKPLLTREHAVALIRERIGIPMTLSTFEKACIEPTGPKPAAKYGRRHLYDEAAILAWGWSRLTPVQNDRAA